MYRCVYVTSVKKIINELTAATVSISNTFVQYLQAFAFPYLVWHSSKNGQNTHTVGKVGQKTYQCTNSEVNHMSLTIKAVHLSYLSALMVST